MSPGPPRPELLALLADCKEHPWEDGLRLILADWLEESSHALDQARAELIRAQVEHERLPPEDPARNAHGRRARALLQRHGKDWLGPLASWVREWTTTRGLHSVGLPVPSLRSKALGEQSATEAWAWVEQVCILSAVEEDVARLAECPLLVGPTSVAFLNGDLGPAGAQALGRSAWLGRILHLDLSQQRLTARGLEALLASPHLGRLRQLDFAGVGLHAEGSALLATSSVARQLERLTLWGNGLGDGGTDSLLAPGTFTSLEVLDLRGNRIGDPGARTLAESPALGQLRKLDLRDNLIGSVGAAALASSPHLGHLESLILWGNRVGSDGVRALVDRFGGRVHVSPAGA